MRLLHQDRHHTSLAVAEGQEKLCSELHGEGDTQAVGAFGSSRSDGKVKEGARWPELFPIITLICGWVELA